MSEPFLAEVKIMGFNFPPRGYAQCDGQLLPINQNQALFSLLGTTYGGDGRTTFALPDLRGRSPIHEGPNYSLGQRGGEEAVALTEAQIPDHTHVVNVSTANATTNQAAGKTFGRAAGATYRASGGSATTMHPQIIALTGSGTGHNNMQPYLALNFVIALQGTFPPRN